MEQTSEHEQTNEPSEQEPTSEAGSSSAVARQHLEDDLCVKQQGLLVGKMERSIGYANVVYQNIYNEPKVGDASRHESHSSGQHNNPEATASLMEELKQILTTRAEKVSGEITLPIELQLVIRFERLELKAGVNRSLPDLDDEGHYNKREDFKELFMRPCQGDISLEKIFDRTLQFATDKTKYETTNEKARTNCIRRHGNIVALIGQAGIGKTTLAKRLIELILKQRVLSNTEYIFVIPFRQVNFSNECPLFRFLVTGCDLKVGSKFDPMSSSWIDELQSNPNVVFIFDGLDEANTNRLSERNNRDTLQAFCKPDVFVRKIFSGEIFPLAKKLVTSRPRQFFELHPSCRPHFAIDILGLNQSSQDKLGKQICQTNFKRVEEFLLDHPDVSSSLYVPVKCIIIFGVLSLAKNKDSQTAVRSLTDIFVQALDHFLRTDHVREKANEVWKLADLAWNGFLHRKIIFNEVDIFNARISKKTFQAFLHTAVERNIRFSILDGDKRSSFSHLIWQELFAAINAMFLLPVNNFDLYIDDLTKPLWEVVSKFMFGLCHPTTRKKVATILSCGAVKDLDVKKKKLFNLVVKLMKEGFYRSFSQLIQLCSWIQEAGDPQLDTAVAEHFPSCIELKGSILPTDVSSLTFAMKRVNKSLSLVNGWPRPSFVQDSFQRLLKGLANLSNKMEMLILCQNVITGEEALLLADTIASIKELHLRECELSSFALTTISKKISCLQNPIGKLALSSNKINDDAATSLADAIANIKKLHLGRCELSSRALITISKKILCLQQPIKKLALFGNVINDEAAMSLSDAVVNIEKLDLSRCQLSCRALIAISKKISCLQKPIKKLALSSNKINDKAAASLADAIANIENLHLGRCELSSRALITISKKISCRQQPMKELDLRDNVIDDVAAASLADAIAKIKRLVVHTCELSSQAKKRISEKCSLHNCELIINY